VRGRGKKRISLCHMKKRKTALWEKEGVSLFLIGEGKKRKRETAL